MPDAMDRVQQHADDLTTDALARHQRQHAARPGRDVCAHDWCGTMITSQRQALGAQLCFECQCAAERRGAR